MSFQIFAVVVLCFLMVGSTCESAYVQPNVEYHPEIYTSNVESLSARLHPGTDIMSGLTRVLTPRRWSALSIASAVGSVQYCWLRLANNSFLSKIEGPMEIASLSGTFDKDLQPHLHIQLANGNGLSIGGHLPSVEERQNTIKSEEEERGRILDGAEGGVVYDCPIFTTL